MILSWVHAMNLVRGGASPKTMKPIIMQMKISASEIMPSADTGYSFAATHDHEQPEYVRSGSRLKTLIP